jgi:hypothetical protein
MGITITNASSQTFPDRILRPGIISRVTEQKVSRTIIYDLPTANFDLLQKLGKKNRRFTIEGECYDDGGSLWLRLLPGVTGSLSYTSANGEIFLPATTILYMEVNFTDKAGRPMERSFNITAVEVI